MVGTHTHVTTADAQILPGGTAYVTDVGMTGSTNGIIGLDKEDFMDLFLGRKPSYIRVSEDPASLSAVLVEVESESRQAINIERVYRVGEQSGSL